MGGQNPGELRHGGREIRLVAEHVFVVGHRLGGFAALDQRRAHVHVGRGVLGLEADGLAEVRHGLLGLALPECRYAQVVPGVGEVGLEADRPLEEWNSLIRPALIHQHRAVVVLRPLVAGHLGQHVRPDGLLTPEDPVELPRRPPKPHRRRQRHHHRQGPAPRHPIRIPPGQLLHDRPAENKGSAYDHCRHRRHRQVHPVVGDALRDDRQEAGGRRQNHEEARPGESHRRLLEQSDDDGQDQENHERHG